MKRTNVMLVDAPREFLPSELFFSITDPRGVIVSGNQVFVRVSGHELHDLIGAPHNIIRHPDMPRAAFKLLWDHLQSGQKVAAYVKNLAKDGRYYWVVAFVSPIDGGYLSIRFLPTSALRDEVEKVYAALRDIELREEEAGDWRHGMELAGAKLGEILGSLGFATYDDLMRHAVHTELVARREAMRAAHDSVLPSLPPAARDEPAAGRQLRRYHREGQAFYRQAAAFEESLHASLNSIQTIAARGRTISELGADFHYLATNITVKAARLGLDGKVLAVIGSRLAAGADVVTQLVKHLRTKATAAEESLKHVLFDMEWSDLQLEMIVAFYREMWMEIVHGDGSASDHWEQNFRDLLRRQTAFDASGRQTVAGLQAFGKALHELARDADELHNAMLTIEVTHVSGLIETKRLVRDGGCSAVFETVRRHIEAMKGDLVAFRAALKELTTIARQAPMMATAFADAVELLNHVGDDVGMLQAARRDGYVADEAPAGPLHGYYDHVGGAAHVDDDSSALEPSTDAESEPASYVG